MQTGGMKRRFELAIVTLAVILFILGSFQFLDAAVHFGAQSLDHGLSVGALCLLATLLGWVLADLLSGLVHFLADNFGRPTTPLIGPLLIAPFREHHRAPEAILHHDFLERNANNALVALPLLLWIPLAHLHTPLSLFGSAICLQLSGWILLTNEIHAQCHLRPVRGPVRWLQRRGLILAPEDHDIHHAAGAISTDGDSGARRDSRFHYCISSGVCDRLARQAARWARYAK